MSRGQECRTLREEVEGTGLVQPEEDEAAVGSICSQPLPT